MSQDIISFQILRHYLDESFIDLSRRIAESPVLQKFIGFVAMGKLPATVKQAHERIVGGRKTENKDKTLSLYDGGICVVTRGKESSEVEFGNVLYLGEQALE